MATVPAKVAKKVGVVIAAHRCAKTVKVRVAKTVHDPHIRNYNQRHECFLAHDERSACVEGDIVTLQPGRTSSTKRHLVTGIMSAVATAHERIAPETYDEWAARRELDYRQRQLRKLAGPNRERYVKKYAQTLPLEVARVREEIRREKSEKREKEKEKEKEELAAAAAAAAAAAKKGEEEAQRKRKKNKLLATEAEAEVH